MLSMIVRQMGLAALVIVASVTVLFAAEEKAKPVGGDAKQVSFFKQIRPIFQAKCHGCHQPAKAGGEYVMTSFDKLLSGGESETASVVAGKPDESYLLELITPTDGEAEMPRGGKPLNDVDIELIRQWIVEGAKNDTPESAKRHYDMEHPPTYSAPPVITSLDYSPDGKWLAVAGFHEVLLHKADGSGLAGRLVGMSERIESVRFSPDGKRLAVTGGLPARMGEVQVWDVETRKLTLSLPITYDTVYGASWSPDGKLIAFGCSDNTVRAIEADSGKQVLYQGSHNDWVLDTAFSVKGTHVMSVSRDRTVKLSELATQRFIDNITSITPGALSGGIASIVRHPKSDVILVGGADGIPKLYRIFRQSKRVIGDDANLVRKFPPLKGRVFGVAISPDGSSIAAVSSDNTSGEVLVCRYQFDDKMPADIKKISMKRSYARSADERKKLVEYRNQGVQAVAQATVKESGLYAVAFHPEGKFFAAAGGDGKIRFYDAQTAKLTKEFLSVPIEPAVAATKTTVSEKEKSQAIAPRPTPSESLETGMKLAGLEVQPTQLTIDHRHDSAQFLVTGRLESGDLIDATRMVKMKISEPVVNVSSTGLVRALANGQTEVTFSLGGQTAKSMITVSGVEPDFPIDMVRDVMPTLTKLGCNSGTCHGAKKGKGGFKLSLRGNDAAYDLRAFTDDLAARRVNLASPENSLMLLKASASVPHGGGQVAALGTPYYEVLHKWIADGTKLDKKSKKTAKIELFPKKPIVQQAGAKQQMRVVATYPNGQTRDVTAEASIQCGDIEVGEADSTGLITVLRRGQAPILARYEGAYAATILTVMGDRDGFVWSNPPTNSFIDELVHQKLKRMRTLPSGLCTDAEFIRRAFLDLTGLPPTPADVQKFLTDSRDTRVKRDELIDKLVGGNEYIEHWTNKWADLLQVNRKFLGSEGSTSFRYWIRTQVADNVPYDRFVYNILTASGSNRENPPASYYKILRTPEETMENTTHLFLGVRFNCNKCHDHPFEKWSQDQYYETAAYFARIGLKKDPKGGDKKIGGTAVEGSKPLYEVVYEKPEGEVKHILSGTVMAPKFPFPAKYQVTENAPRRDHLAAWITSKDNRYFARSYVNRIWAYLLGVGFIEPIDDIRAGNPATNPELLDRLTKEFIDSGFNVRSLVRSICKSRTYQLSIATNKWNTDDQINYSHAIARRLPAEVLYDTLHRVTGSVSKFANLPRGIRAAQLPDAGFKEPSGFLARFGRPPRESACECERSSGMQFGPVMALVTGPTVGDAVADPNNEIARLVAERQDDAKLIDGLFMRILSRGATAAEVEAGVEMMREIPDEHEHLLAAMVAREKFLAPVMVAQEKQRQTAIAAAKSALDAYQKMIAPRVAELDKQQKARTALLETAQKEYEQTLPQLLAAWEARPDRDTNWVALDPTTLAATNGAKLEKQKDLSVTASGPNGTGDYQITAETTLTGIRAIRLEALVDKDNPKKGPGRSDDGNFVLTELEVFVAPKGQPDKKTKLKLIGAQADFSQKGYDVATAIDGSVRATSNGWAISAKTGENHYASFKIAQPIGKTDGVILTIHLKQLFNSKKHSLGRFRLSVTNSAAPLFLNGVPQKFAKILTVPSAKRTEPQKAELLKFHSRFDKVLKQHQQAVAESKKPRAVDPILKAMQENLAIANRPVPLDPLLKQLRHDVGLSGKQLANARLTAAQDISWALINSPAFLFNR